MCDFQRGTIECRGDGYLWDADCDGFDPGDHSDPCPKCNTEAFLRNRKEEAENTSSFSNGFESGTGADIWGSGTKIARDCNPSGVDTILQAIGHVDALVADDSAEGYHVLTFHYTAIEGVAL